MPPYSIKHTLKEDYTILVNFSNKDRRPKKQLANRQYYRSLIDLKTESAFLVDFDGDILMLNPRFEAFTGYTENDLTEVHVRNIFLTSKDRSNPFDTRQLREFSDELYMVDPVNYLVPVNLDFKEIEGQKFLGTLKETQVVMPSQPSANSPAVLKPRPQSPQGSELRTSSEPYWSIDQQHDVRTALNGIMGFGSILLKDGKITADKKITGFVEGILKNSNRLKTILDKQNTENHDDIISANLTTVDIGSILQKVKIMLEPQSIDLGITLNFSQNINLRIVTDESRLYRILYFFVEKAILYTRNAEVSINVEEEFSPDKLNIKIDNIGMDVPTQVINFIRRENSRPTYDANNQILNDHVDVQTLLRNLNAIEGKIFFQTGAHLGEIVTISFSKQSITHPDEAESRIENEIRQKKLKILIVEDDKINALILSLYIRDLVDVTTAFSGNEALNIVEMQYNHGVVFNLVLMDIGLPEPWNGVLLKKEIENKWPEYSKVPFVAQTAHTHDSWAEKIMLENFKGYLIKPLVRLEILMQINKFTT